MLLPALLGTRYILQRKPLSLNEYKAMHALVERLAGEVFIADFDYTYSPGDTYTWLVLGSFDSMETHTLLRRRKMADRLTFFELHISNLHTSAKKQIQYNHIQANIGSRNTPNRRPGGQCYDK